MDEKLTKNGERYAALDAFATRHGFTGDYPSWDTMIAVCLMQHGYTVAFALDNVVGGIKHDTGR